MLMEVVSLDLTGKKFGRWTLLERAGHNKHGHRMWLCECECGTKREVNEVNLVNGHSSSCGCYRNELGTKKLKESAHKFREFLEKDSIDGTRVSTLERKQSSRNKSGFRGISKEKKSGKWRASIGFQNKRIYLGAFYDINDAVAARKEAEEKYYKPILDAAAKRKTEVDPDE